MGLNTLALWNVAVSKVLRCKKLSKTIYKVTCVSILFFLLALVISLTVHCFEGNCNTDVAQPTLSLPLALSLPMSDPKTSDPANDTLQFDFEHDSWTLWTDGMYACGDYPGSAFDTALGARTPDKSAVPVASNMIPLVTSHPASGISSPAETTSTPGLHQSVSSYSTPSTTYVDSPHMGEQLLPGLGATMLNQAVKRKRRDSDRSMQ